MSKYVSPLRVVLVLMDTRVRKESLEEVLAMATQYVLKSLAKVVDKRLILFISKIIR